LIFYRCEIRPEHVSYLFLGTYLALLYFFQKGKISAKTLYVSIFIFQILWVNTHIYFVFGPVIISAFLLNEFISNRWRKSTKTIVMALGLSMLALFINPNLYKSVFAAFIFKNFGYRLFENQTISFLENLGFENPVFDLLKISSAIILLLFVVSFINLKNLRKAVDPVFMMAVLFGCMAYFSVRDITIFGFFAITAMSTAGAIVFVKASNKFKINKPQKIGIFLFLLTIILAFHYFTYFKNSESIDLFTETRGIGIYAGNENSAIFFKKNKIQGPIFNNYDIGGFLIYHLFPNEKVFVDNRPEYYPAQFFENLYVPMQENDDIWKKADKIYGFNAIFFQRMDRTSWAQSFLIKRVKDKNWVPVFVDDFSIIFVKNDPKNKNIIDKYAIPENYFTITESQQ